MSSCNLKNEICGFKCTGFKGGHIWQKFRDIIKNHIDCEHCQDEGMHMISFLQDFSHGGLGMDLYDKKNFLDYADRVRCVADSLRDHELE